MRPVCVFAKGSGSEIEQLRACLRGRSRQAARAAMVQLPPWGLSAARRAVLLGCHPAMARRWIGRFSTEGMAGLAGRPAPGWPSTVGRHTAAQQDRRAAGPAGAVDAATDLVLPARRPPAGSHAGQEPAGHRAWRVWAGLKNYVANTAVTWPGRLRRIHSCYRNRSPSQMLATAAEASWVVAVAVRVWRRREAGMTIAVRAGVHNPHWQFSSPRS